ncbi:polar amino acid transport system substrate-binding protein [Cupriavidus sp. YR651]|uniref:transporter substrate-binding domain-containing protein n=1 Tax=Cupriavidus sp. YR651 TaxID=1855315 RepID=UPI0008882D63|nr:transporter substrate-binding domain-containing protein [Cupriavidus sp. YR651]SDC71663.1 polar amino acid transport system substrate-binding protein [Cupriavidus sp. YR651]
MAEVAPDLPLAPARAAVRPVHGFWLAAWLVLAAVLLVAVTAPRWLERMPHVPERLPPAVQDWLRHLQRDPDWAAMPRGPLLDAVKRNGELVVVVRQYARPSPPNRPTPPEPDAFDVSLGRYIADRLQVRLRVVATSMATSVASPVAPGGGLPGVDMGVAGALEAGAPTVQTAYTGGAGALLVLQGSAYRHPNDLNRREVCVGQGSPYAHTLTHSVGAISRVYPSSIRAIAAFMAGECQALAEDQLVVSRLLGLPEWRFYRKLDAQVAPDNDRAQLAIRLDDPQSAAWIDRAVRHWKLDGAFAAARERRAGDIAYEASQLGDGLVCHS